MSGVSTSVYCVPVNPPGVHSCTIVNSGCELPLPSHQKPQLPSQLSWLSPHQSSAGASFWQEPQVSSGDQRQQNDRAAAAAPPKGTPTSRSSSGLAQKPLQQASLKEQSSSEAHSRRPVWSEHSALLCFSSNARHTCPYMAQRAPHTLAWSLSAHESRRYFLLSVLASRSQELKMAWP